MNVIDGLAGVRPLVEDHSIASIRHPLLTGDLACGGEDSPEEMVIVELSDRIDVPARQDQEMNRRLRVEIGEGDDVVIAVEGFEIRIGDQPAKDAGSQATSSN